MTDAQHSLLGKETRYDQGYSPDILFPLARSDNREILNIKDALPFHGEDLWTCYELSWLDSKGKPNVGIAYFAFPANSPFMIESKSFKLYLNAINHLSFESVGAVEKLLRRDISHAAGVPVNVDIQAVDSEKSIISNGGLPVVCIDDLDIGQLEYQPNSDLLSVEAGSCELNEYLCSHLLRSNCPVTGQPDWASVYIHYSGQKINRESLLRYIISFRQCQDFHENCVERIFTDLIEKCRCDSLSVYARYTRRGGLDINPYRATPDLSSSASLFRTARQ